MFKRRDWKLLDGEDSSDSDSSESNSGNASEDAPSSEEQGSSGSSGSEQADESQQGEQGSSGDSEAGEAEPEAQQFQASAAEVVQDWTSTSTEEQQRHKGVSLRCTACNALLLNRLAYLSHIASKKHTRKTTSHVASMSDKPFIMLATEAEQQPEEEETHMERFERMRYLAASAPQQPKAARPAQKARPGKSKPPTAEQGEGGVAGSVSEGPSVAARRKGKRERAEQKVAWEQQGLTKPVKRKKPEPGAVGGVKAAKAAAGQAGSVMAGGMGVPGGNSKQRRAAARVGKVQAVK